MTPDVGQILAKLGALVLVRRLKEEFLPVGCLPAWCRLLSPRPVRADAAVSLTEVFPYFELFLHAAEEIWAGDGSGRLEMGGFTQILADGTELHLTGTALLVQGEPVLVVTENDRAFRQERLVLQRARELRIMYDELSHEIEQHDVLTHCLVHDLRNPLSAVLSAVSLLERQNLNERASQIVDIARQAARAQADLISDLLTTFAERKHTESERTAHRPRADAAAAILQVTAMMNPRARAVGVSLEAIVPHSSPAADDAGPTLAPSGTGVEVFADSLRLFRVIGNLVENAMKYSSPGMTVRITVHEEPDFAVVGVEDEGPGVPPGFVPRLFDKLSRVEDGVHGTGLGLFFCRITVDSWGGKIGYEPRPVRGSRFWFSVPLAAA